MLKTGLNIAHFKQHVEVIEEETKEYFSRWGESGVKSKRNIRENSLKVKLSAVRAVQSELSVGGPDMTWIV